MSGQVSNTEVDLTQLHGDKNVTGFYSNRTMKLLNECSFQIQSWQLRVAWLNQSQEISAATLICYLITVFS